MKIAIVIEQYFPAAGGNERSTSQIAERLVARGHDATVITNLSPAEGDMLPGGKVLSRSASKGKSVFSLLAFALWADRQLRHGDYDVSLSVTLAVPANVMQPRSGTVRETLLRNIARRRSASQRWLKVISIALNPKQLALLGLEWRTMRHPRVKKVVTISRYVADQLFRHYTIAMRRTEMIPNAASVRAFEPGQRQRIRQKIRHVWKLDDDDVAFVFAAMNPGLKGLNELLDAFALLKDEQSPARLLVAGTMGHSFFEKAKSLGIDHMVRWFGPTRQIDSLYAAADVTILPTFYDPSSKVVIESLLHGIPAISTRYNGASQWIIDPAHGQANTSPYAKAIESLTTDAIPAGRMISSPQAIEEMAQAIRELCDPAQRQQCVRACERIDPRLSMDHHVDTLERLLSDVAGTDDQSASLAVSPS